MPNDAYGRLMERVKDVGRLGSISALLEWDQETQMPPEGLTARAEQVALIAGLTHERLVADDTKRLLDEATAADDDYVAVTNLRETRRSYERSARIPTALVKDIAHTSTLAMAAWAKARAQSKFSLFAPMLGKMIDFKKQVAEHIGFETESYDALMDEFEPGARAADIASLFSELRKATSGLLSKLMRSDATPDASILTRPYAIDKQKVLSRRMAEALNYDFKAGRADTSVHPFCTTIGGGGDVRVTTRYMEKFLPAAMFGTMHEVGHALYEQGLPREHLFTPMAEAVSLGIHESQSRMWENMVGRSGSFWTHHYSAVQALFPESLTDVSMEEFYRAINSVSPSFVRVEADEVTYNLHIILRFELERALFNGELDVDGIPTAWNEKMTSMMGITPSKDADGCLQDVHWSMGAFGYFPTYALGNLYAAQFFERATQDIPDLATRIATNDHAPLLSWLRENIHQHGRRYGAAALVEKVTGKPLSIEPFVSYATEKFSKVYQVG